METLEAARKPVVIRLSTQMDRATLEALALEIRQLAKRHGIEVQSLQITRDTGESAYETELAPGSPAGSGEPV